MNLGLVACLVFTCFLVYEGSMVVGDFVMINTYMIQLFIPLNFLGFYWRTIRQSMI